MASHASFSKAGSTGGLQLPKGAARGLAVNARTFAYRLEDHRLGLLLTLNERHDALEIFLVTKFHDHLALAFAHGHGDFGVKAVR